MFYTYVLQSEKDEEFYVGFTKDLKLRFEKHNKGNVESTRDRRPLKLIYYEACVSQLDATKPGEIPENVSWKNVLEEQAQILFNRVNQAQLLTYLKLTNLQLGFLLNWNVTLMKHGIKRMVNNLKQ